MLCCGSSVNSLLFIVATHWTVIGLPMCPRDSNPPLLTTTHSLIDHRVHESISVPFSVEFLPCTELRADTYGLEHKQKPHTTGCHAAVNTLSSSLCVFSNSFGPIWFGFKKTVKLSIIMASTPFSGAQWHQKPIIAFLSHPQQMLPQPSSLLHTYLQPYPSQSLNNCNFSLTCRETNFPNSPHRMSEDSV